MINTKPIKILLVEDDEDDYLIARSYLSEINQFPFQLDWVQTFNEAVEVIKTGNHEIYLIDYLLGAKSGLELLQMLKDTDRDLPAIMLTGKGDERIDRQAIELGAYDYLEKSTLRADALERSIRYALKHADTLRALRENERKYRTVFEKSKEIIFITDEDFNIISISKAVEEFLGYSIEEIYDMNTYELFENPMVLSEMQDLMQEEDSLQDFMINLKAKNNEVKTGLIYCVKERDQDGHFFLHGIFSDQTDRIRAERALLQSQKLQSTARLMQVLAHEVRNPLMNINLSVESLSDLVSDDAEGVLDIIQRNARKIDQLITRVLNAAAEKDIPKKPEDLNSVVMKAVEEVKDRAAIQGVRLNLQFVDNLPILNLNSEMLSTAFVNIMVNAIEAMEGCENPVLKVQTLLKNNRAKVIVTDNGIGMDEELLSKLFEPFYTAKTNGVGLGLASTLNILKAHDALIEVTSELGKGARFLIGFDLAKEPKEVEV